MATRGHSVTASADTGLSAQHAEMLLKIQICVYLKRILPNQGPERELYDIASLPEAASINLERSNSLDLHKLNLMIFSAK